MGDPPADEDEEAESARARSEGESEADEDLEDDEVDSDEETDVDSDDDMVCSRPCRDACTRRTRAPHARRQEGKRRRLGTRLSLIHI